MDHPGIRKFSRRTPSRMRVRASAAALGRTLFGTNFTDRSWSRASTTPTLPGATYAITRVSTNQPRTIGLNFQYKF